jgi:plastocyanin
MANFIDLYRETNPGERRMQSARGLQDTGFQGIVKAYQMGKGGAEASAYDEKRAEAAGRYAKRQEALDSIKALKDAVPMVENYFWSQIKQGKSKEEAAKATGEFANFAIPKGLLPEGWEIKLVESIPEEGRDVVRADSYNPKTGMNEVKFLSVGNKTYNVEQFDGTTGKWIPFTGVSSKKTASEQGGAPRTQELIVDAEGKSLGYQPSNAKLKPGQFKAKDMVMWENSKGEQIVAPKSDISPSKKGFKKKLSNLEEIFKAARQMRDGGGSAEPADSRIPSPF